MIRARDVELWSNNGKPHFLFGSKPKSSDIYYPHVDTAENAIYYVDEYNEIGIIWSKPL